MRCSSVVCGFWFFAALLPLDFAVVVCLLPALLLLCVLPVESAAMSVSSFGAVGVISVVTKYGVDRLSDGGPVSCAHN